MSFLKPRIPSYDTAQALMAAAESWLSRRGAWFRVLPPLLRAEYERQTRRQRSRSVGLVSLVGSVVSLLFYPTLNSAVPDLQDDVTRLFLCGAVPFSFAMALLVMLDPTPLLRETLLGLSGIVNAAVLTYLFVRTRIDATELYVASMLVMMLFVTVTVQVRFSIAVGVVAAILALFAEGVRVALDGTPRLHRDLFLAALVSGIYMLMANGRMHAEQQRGFVLTLRERLRRHDLFQRNLELDELVRRDALTGLANRRAYDAWLQNSWRQARAGGTSLGLIVVDVDRFKAYNDFYGHPSGDACLQAIARCLREQLRGTSDRVARIGGEEFSVVLPGLDGELCADVAERLRAAVAALELPHLDNEHGRIVTISCGAASLLATEPMSPRDLVAAADAALYHAKQTGRNRVCLADTVPVVAGAQPPLDRAAAGRG